MQVISATVGSGSTFIAEQFKRYNWQICVRPDKYLRTHSSKADTIYTARVGKYIKLPPNVNKLSNNALCELAYNGLIGINNENMVLLSMAWGGLGYINELPPQSFKKRPTKPIYVIRHPLFAFNSYSGGGWRKTNKRIKPYANLNDWADEWLGNRSLWIDHALNALKALNEGKAYIVKYHTFAKDWANLPLSLPPIHKQFKCKDNMDKIILPKNTINYLMDKTGKTWDMVNKET